jgi:hypothetical protein
MNEILSNEETLIMECINSFFDIFCTLEIQKIKEVCCDDFVMVENGEIENCDSLAELIGEIIGNYRRINEVSARHFKIKEGIASIVYYNKAQIIQNGYLVNYNWHESALLVFEQGKWRIRLLHSTVLEKNINKL